VCGLGNSASFRLTRLEIRILLTRIKDLADHTTLFYPIIDEDSDFLKSKAIIMAWHGSVPAKMVIRARTIAKMAATSSLPRKLLTLAFLVRQRATTADSLASFEVLLGEKKRGFGVGKWNGFGGKVEAADASIVAAAAREIQEEANVSVLASDLEPRGVITFTFEGGKEMLVRALARKVEAVED